MTAVLAVTHMGPGASGTMLGGGHSPSYPAAVRRECQGSSPSSPHHPGYAQMNFRTGCSTANTTPATNGSPTPAPDRSFGKAEGPNFFYFHWLVRKRTSCSRKKLANNPKWSVINCSVSSESTPVTRASKGPLYSPAAILIAALASQRCADNCATRKGVIF